MRLLLAASVAAASAGHSSAPDAAPLPSAPSHGARGGPVLPGFAAALAERPMPAGAAAWPKMSRAEGWSRLAAASSAERQGARWDFANSLIADGRGADALGALEVMRADDPDLSLVPGWLRAKGVAAIQAAHLEDGMAALADPMLVSDAESCLWRLRALTAQGQSRRALAQLHCAMPALNARGWRGRYPFILAVATAGVALGQNRPVIDWLAILPDQDPAANLLRGEAMLALNDTQEGKLRLARVALSGDAEQRAAAELATLRVDLAGHTVPTAEAAKRLDRLTFTWRGDEVEKQALHLRLDLAMKMHDTSAALAAGAALFRYGAAGPDAGALSEQLRGLLATALSPQSKLPLPQAAGLFWDYRDLAPAGAAGDRLVDSLIDRLQGAGLYMRAADLLQYRLTATAQDIEQGPLSVRVATLRILAGRPELAVRSLRETDQVAYPASMLADRRRVEAAALDILGRRAEALAALQDVPDAAGIAAEIHWQARDWAHLAEVGESALPAPGKLSDVGQAVVLRHAIALAMLRREPALTRLHARYAASFATLPTAAAFALLTAMPDTVDPAALAKAMASLPSASPAGEIGDLIEEGREAMATAAATPPPPPA
ncbi:hypothetical protein ASG67_13850 [Sphingomonas sp. Leaf339]|nr:hypothetical protein ASG67_13850 [Sphingomonas sp. Leaf339]